MSVSHVMQIEEIGLDDQGRLFVRPSAASADEFTQIYRAGMSIRWNGGLRALHAYESARWDAIDVYRRIFAAALDEYGIQLRVTPGTAWTRIPADIRKETETFDLRTWATST